MSTGLEVQDGDCHLLEIYVAYFDRQGFRYAASEAKEQSNKKPVAVTGRLILDDFNIFGVKICFHVCLPLNGMSKVNKSFSDRTEVWVNVIILSQDISNRTVTVAATVEFDDCRL